MKIFTSLAPVWTQLGLHGLDTTSEDAPKLVYAFVPRTDAVITRDVWDTLGYIEFHLGDFARAADHFELALALCRDRGDRGSLAWILTHAGNARHAVGELPQARRAWQQALAIFDDLQHPSAGRVRAKLASLEDQVSGN